MILTMAYILYFLAVVLMVFAILLQEGKGGGLAGLGGARAEATFGASNPLRRFTVVMALAFFFLAVFIDHALAGRRTITEEEPAAPVGQEGPAEPPAGKGETAAPAEAAPAAGEERSGEAAPGAGEEGSSPGAAAGKEGAPPAGGAGEATPSTAGE